MPQLEQILAETTASNMLKIGIKFPLWTEMPYSGSRCNICSVSNARMKNNTSDQLCDLQTTLLFFFCFFYLDVEWTFKISAILANLARGLKTNSVSDLRSYMVLNMADVVNSRVCKVVELFECSWFRKALRLFRCAEILISFVFWLVS